MKMFECKLINNNEIQESLVRAGNSVAEVLERLNNFLWPNGEWEISEIINDDN